MSRIATLQLFALLVLAFVASAATAQPTEQVYTSSPNAPIPPFDVIQDEIAVPSGGRIADLRVEPTIAHPNVGDLTLQLEHVDTGTLILLINQPNFGAGTCTGNDIQIQLNDAAPLDVQTNCAGDPNPAYTSGEQYRPAEPLSNFDGELMAGTWRLTVANGGSFPGTFTKWALRITPVVFTVNAAHDTPDAVSGDGVCDDGTLLPGGTPRCTLRAAIQEANALGGDVTIALDLLSPTRGGSSVGYDATNDTWTIAVTSQLPTITAPNVTLDGTSQQAGDAPFKDATCGDLLGGTPHLLKVMLDGSGAPIGADGLFVDDPATNVHLRGLVVGNFDDVALSLDGDGATLTCSYVGTDHSGTTAAPSFRGIHLIGQDITIGGTAPGDGNVISGSTESGITNFNGNNVIQGNLIGTDVTGASALPNDAGITVGGSTLTIGGTTAAARNVISGNTSNGIQFLGLGDLTVIQGNYIGTDVTGSTALGNDVGVRIAEGSSGIDVGGVADGAGNVISGNASGGVEIVGSSGN
ncbi:MAG: CSLREA domain-containing protein, partial [Bacteroidetes bacterium]|nr:CSLREA domain-containing protein [Bacteroidota bacterium]